MFYLIGITKEGLYEDDFDQLFEEEDTQATLNSLVELSLIQFETLVRGSTSVKRFRVSTFLDKYVDQKLSVQSKRDLNMLIATYYKNKLLKFKRDYAKDSDQSVLQERLVKYEKNILYCLKQLFEIDSAAKTSDTELNKASMSSNPTTPKKQSQKLSGQMVDKNMLDIGNATFKQPVPSSMIGDTLAVPLKA